MAIIATPSRRRLAMATLLLLAVAGGVIRHFADNPSTLRDVGTLMLVLWLPAIGNLIGYLLRKIPQRPPQAHDFAADSVFTPHLQARLQPLEAAGALRDAIAPGERRCIVLVGRQAFRARLAEPLSALIGTPAGQVVALQLLRPEVALAELRPGAEFHLLAGTTAVAKGRVLEP
jgi:hypothetical protein